MTLRAKYEVLTKSVIREENTENSVKQAKKQHLGYYPRHLTMRFRLGIDYTKLTTEEFQLLIKVLEKSKHLNIPRSKFRKKRK